jgi:hypothetical protein
MLWAFGDILVQPRDLVSKDCITTIHSYERVARLRSVDLSFYEWYVTLKPGHQNIQHHRRRRAALNYLSVFDIKAPQGLAY